MPVLELGVVPPVEVGVDADFGADDFPLERTANHAALHPLPGGLAPLGIADEVVQRMIVEEHLQTPTLHVDRSQSLDAAWRLYVGDALRQQQGGPCLGARAGARRLARRVNRVVVQREPRFCGQDRPDLWHVLGDDRE